MNAKTGTLYLVPAPLDFGCDAQAPLENALPQATLQTAARLTHWVCENAKSTRAYLKRIDALEKGAGGLGVLAEPVGEGGGGLDRAQRQHVLQRRLCVAAVVQRRGHQVKRALGGGGRAHGSVSPAARSRRAVRISGRPTRAVG